MDYKKLITIELNSLKEELGKIGVQNQNTPQDWIPLPQGVNETEPDQNVVADRSEDWQETRGILDTLETRYNNLTRALNKIENNNFGHCEICEQPIEEDRLAANPAARTCKKHLEEEVNLPL